MRKHDEYTRLFREFDHLSVLIIGDVMVDSYLWGKVERISPEAPIPVVVLKRRENRMGGAANVALNIKSLGARPVLCSVIGADAKGDEFMDLIDQASIENSGIVRSKNRITTTKYRIFGNTYQMLRVDEEVEYELNDDDYHRLLDRIHLILDENRIDCIIFQDYDKGVISERVIREVVLLAQQKDIPVAVDPKRKNFMSYQNVTLFKPNLKELKEGLKLEFDGAGEEDVIGAAQLIREKLNSKYVLSTLSENGMMMSMKDEIGEKNFFIPAHIRSVADVSGAGDTVISVASLCLALHRSPYEIAFISNLAGGLVCEEAGVVPVNKHTLLKEVLALI